MDSIIGVIIGVILSALVGVGYYTYEDSQVDNALDKVIALREARSLVSFTEAFNSYVQHNQSSITGNGGGSNENPMIVTAATMDLPTSEGIDALGQSLEGVISTPYGSSLSWIVIPVSGGNIPYTTPSGSQSSATTEEMMKKYGLNNPVKSEQFWGEVSADIVKISSGQINGYVYNDVNQTFVPSLSGSLIQAGQSSPTYKVGGNHNSVAWDLLSNYFPNSGVPYPQTQPQPYSPYQFSIIASSALSKSPGYWVWAINLYNNWGSSGEAPGGGGSSDNQVPFVSSSFYSVGFSPGCPIGGITPTVYNGPAYGCESGSSCEGNAQMQQLTTDPTYQQNFMTRYICLPMSLSTYTQIANNFKYDSACTSDNSVDCQPYTDSKGKQIGYEASCSGNSCIDENENNGEGWNPNNHVAGSSTLYQGEKNSQQAWQQQAFNQEVDYLYGTYLIDMPGGFEYTLFWSSGMNFDSGGNWWFFGDQVGLFSGNVVNQEEYTVNNPNGYPSNPWAFTVDNDPNDVNSSENSNFTVINLN